METDEAVNPMDVDAPANPQRRGLELIMGSFFIPKDNPQKPLGEDSFFILEAKQTFGLADGVGGWAKKGIDSGLHARELMENAFNYILNLPTDVPVDPTQVLEHAYSKTNAKGSSTACIVTLKGDSVHAVNIGDSGFVVIRDGEVVFKTIPKQHYFNCPFQLGNSVESDSPALADEIFVPVVTGDVIVAGTDGLFDNVYQAEIEKLVEICLKQERDMVPDSMAMVIAEVALLQSMCKLKVSPFIKASMEAGFDISKCMGGKYDDITVVVAYVVWNKYA